MLTILPYAGLILTTVSTIWGLTHELYTRNENNERRLTKAGRHSIAFALLGLFISLNTAVLKTVTDNQDKAEAKAADDRKRQEDALEKIASQQREETLARQTQEKIDRKANEQQKLEIEGFSRTERLAREQMLAEVQRAAESAEHAQKIISDLDRSLHPLFPIKIHATFQADLREPLYAAYRERLIKAAPADEESPWPELGPDTSLFPDRNRERYAFNLLMAPPQMSVFLVRNPAESPGSFEKKEPDLNFVLKSTAPDPPLPVGKRPSPRPKIDREYGFSKVGVVSIHFPTETISKPDYSNGQIVSDLDLLGARMKIEISRWFTLSLISIELPGGREIQLGQNEEKKDFERSEAGNHMI